MTAVKRQMDTDVRVVKSRIETVGTREHDLFHERAGILQFQSGVPQTIAEQTALMEIVTQYQQRQQQLREL